MKSADKKPQNKTMLSGGHSLNLQRETDHKRRKRIIGWTNSLIYKPSSTVQVILTFHFSFLSTPRTLLPFPCCSQSEVCTLCSAWNVPLEETTQREPPTCQEPHILWPSETQRSMRTFIIAGISYYSSSNQRQSAAISSNVKKKYLETLYIHVHLWLSYLSGCHQ